ncbi:uncharacterized protein LOC124110876, partial [Haliotis rufescens]|uniref:uncharacterized protein LOC124110876 n=1 Tax=Haliotis rufescens TaxID=6454 RepID=UPI00201F1876
MPNSLMITTDRIVSNRVTMKSFRRTLMLMVLYLTVASTRKNGWAPRWMVNLLCTETSALTQVPWDCTGYLHCYTQGITTYGVWVNCPPNLRFDQISGNCLRFSPACVDMAKIASKYCPFYPHLTFPHPESCAMFYDCSRKTPNVTYGLKIYENECPFPTLFSTTLETCTDNLTDNNVRCNNAPATKCDYRTECVIESRACVQDGYAPTPGTVLSADYIECQAGKIKATLKCKSSSEIFDPLRKLCTSNISQLVDAYCGANPTAKFSDPVNCARYYDCSKQVHYTGLNPYQSECQYLYLFEESSGTCILFYMMKTPCGKKLEPKAPCDYRIGQCLGRQYCMACSASCIGQPDGKVQYPGIPSTRYHLICRDERTMDIQECAKGFIFDTKIRGCLPDVDEILTTAGVTTTASTTTPVTTSTTDPNTSTDVTTTVAATTTTASAGTTSTRASTDVTSTVVSTTTTSSAGTASTTASTDVTSTAVSTTTTASAGTTSTTASMDVTSTVALTTTTAPAGTASTTASTDVTSTVASTTTTVSAGITSTVASTSTTATPVQDICPCENFTSLSERLDNLTSITSSLAEQLKATVRSPFDCVAPPMPVGTVAQIYYEGPLAVARYTCAVKDEVFCAGSGVSRCAGRDTWSPVSRCGRAMWQNVTNNSITLDCPPSDQGSLSFTVEGLNDFRVELKEDEAILLSFRVNLTEGVLVVVNGTGNATLTASQRSSDTDWRINFNNDTLGLSLSGFKQDDVFFPPTNFSGFWMLTVTGDVELKEVRLTTSGTPAPVPRGKSGVETRGAIDSVNTVNRALNQQVFASAYMNSLYKLETVVDGNNDNNVSDNHCFMTAVMEPWVMVDLGSLYHVTAVILTRSDSFESRLRNIEIVVCTQNPEVIPTAVVKSCASKPGQLSYQERIQCTAPVIGRFVRVQYMAGVRDILTVCEIEVYGADVTGWNPFLCPDPPLLDKSMVDVHYSLTAAVAVYSCDDGYSGGCDDNNLLYCTSVAGWEGRPQTCIKVDAGTEKTVGRVEIPCPLQIGFAHELWLESRESGSYILFQAGTDVLLMINIQWAQGGAEVTFRNRIDGRIAPIEADAPELFKNGTLAHVVVLFLSDHYQFLVDNHPLIAVPHMTSSPNIDLIDGTGMFIKKVKLNQDWRQRVVKDNYANYSFNKSTFATSNLLASDGVVDGNVTYTTLSSTCWQAAAADEAPYWQVDTGGYYHIKRVMVSARSRDGCSGNCDSGLHDFALDLYMTNPSSDPDAKARLCQFYNGYIRFSTSEFIQCRRDTVGRYVVLRATRKTSANDLLTVCEVEVWGTKSVMK